MVRSVLLLAVVALGFASRLTASPNLVLIFADDLGYADLGCYGATGWATPNLDRLARQGVRFTDFYVAQPVCSASRAALLTGCYPNRLGLHGALGPNAAHGISDTELTLAELLKAKGYATGMVGKWHLGHHPRFLPGRHGFDEHLGLPYSNDMWPSHPSAKPGTYPPLPLLDGDRVLDPDVTAAAQATLTRRYTDRALSFLERSKDRPFFLYFAHTFPHVPLFVGDKFKGSSKQGLYGDVIQEFDAAVGELLAALDKHQLADNTLVVFTSDNGPWLSYGNHAGTAGPLREGKGTCWEGGVRVPCVARWPGKIPAGAVQAEPAMTIDLLPTVAKLVGSELPEHGVDGKDVWPLFACEPGAKCPHEAYLFYYRTNELHAVRSGQWKLMLPHTAAHMAGQTPGADGKPGRYAQVKVGLELYDLAADLGETTNVADKHPEVVKRLLGHAERARADLGDSLTNRVGAGVREPGRVEPRPNPPAPFPKRQAGRGVRLIDGAPEFTSELVFPLNPQHNHAPGIAELPSGDLLVSWYRGSGERTADDVQILAALKQKGDAAWTEPFQLADTPGFPDCNTALFVDPKGKLWLFWPVVLANSWESCLTHYRTASKFDAGGRPVWDWQGVIPLKPKDFEPVMLREFAAWKERAAGLPVPKALGEEYVRGKVRDKLLSRLGWQPRCKPVVLKSGRILLPLYSDTYSAGLMAVSDDGGATWGASQPLAGFGSIQPTVFERADGTVVAYMRENGVFNKVRVCESKDGGISWGAVTESSLPNPGSGLDGVRLANGHWLLVYNDTATGRGRLAVSVSDDEGKSWKWTRHLEDDPAGRFHYPAVIQAKDGGIHAVYSYFVAGGKSMKHARFTEEWVKVGR